MSPDAFWTQRWAPLGVMVDGNAVSLERWEEIVSAWAEALRRHPQAWRCVREDCPMCWG